MNNQQNFNEVESAMRELSTLYRKNLKVLLLKNNVYEEPKTAMLRVNERFLREAGAKVAALGVIMSDVIEEDSAEGKMVLVEFAVMSMMMAVSRDLTRHIAAGFSLEEAMDMIEANNTGVN